MALKLDSAYSGCRCVRHSLDFSDACKRKWNGGAIGRNAAHFLDDLQRSALITADDHLEIVILITSADVEAHRLSRLRRQAGKRREHLCMHDKLRRGGCDVEAELKRVLAKTDPNGLLELVVVDTDGCLDLYLTPEFLGKMHGSGETAWIKHGVIVFTSGMGYHRELFEEFTPQLLQ